MTRTFKVELTVNMHEGKITSMYVEKVEEKTTVGSLEIDTIRRAITNGYMHQDVK